MARSDLSAKLHARIFRLSGGRIGGVVQGKAVLLLATTGRRSGRRREVVVNASSRRVPDGSRSSPSPRLTVRWARDIVNVGTTERMT